MGRQLRKFSLVVSGDKSGVATDKPAYHSVSTVKPADRLSAESQSAINALKYQSTAAAMANSMVEKCCRSAVHPGGYTHVSVAGAGSANHSRGAFSDGISWEKPG